MARLLVINGGPALGKSTLARLYGQGHPQTFVFDLDRLRTMVSGWDHDLPAAHQAAAAVTLAGARAHLRSGRDVVVPQVVASGSTFLDDLREVAASVGADYAEVVLTDTLENTLARFEARTARAEDPAHAEIARVATVESITRLHAAAMEALATRPHAVEVVSVDGDPEGTYRALLRLLGEA